MFAQLERTAGPDVKHGDRLRLENYTLLETELPPLADKVIYLAEAHELLIKLQHCSFRCNSSSRRPKDECAGSLKGMPLVVVAEVKLSRQVGQSHAACFACIMVEGT